GRDSVPVRTPHQSFCALTGVAVLLPCPSSVVLRTPNALSVMLLCVTDEAAAPTRRTAAPSRRFWSFSAWLPTAYVVPVAPFVQAGAGEVIDATGAPAPCTRFEVIVVPEISTDAPAVTRTPSWPKFGQDGVR